MSISDTYEDYDAIGLAELVAGGQVKPEELLDAAVTRLEARNPSLNAVVRPMVEEAQAAIAAGLPEGPLRGVPYLLKDLFFHYAGVPTTNGCRFFDGAVPDHDADLVVRMKRAGLVIFGKTATPEFGLSTTTESLLFGATDNPWKSGYTPGGSSGGASSAVAAGILPAAHASDGGGSIRIPASCCGLFGLKPTRARMSFGPDLGESWSGMSTAHAVTRSVRDSAALLDATHGASAGDPYWAPPPPRPYLDEVGADPGRLRIALQTLTWNGLDTDPECVTAARSAADLCAELGHKVEEARIELDWEPLGKAAATIIGASVLTSLEARAETVGRPFGEDDVEPMAWTMTQTARQAGAADYVRATRAIHAAGRSVERFFQRYDALLTPTMALPPPRQGVLSLSNPDRKQFTLTLLRSTGFTQLFNMSGHPAMSVPLHWSPDGLPIGVQFAGRFGDEGGLLKLAAQLEQARPWFDRRAV